jgi:glycine oxidase
VTRLGADVAVVGAGIIGCSIAWECARRGARVVLIDRGRAGAEASAAAAGMLAPASEAHGPGAFLDLGLEALRLWPAFAADVEERSGLGCGLQLDGLLRIAGDPAAASELRARLRWQAQAGIDASWLDPAEAAEAEPACSATAQGAVLYHGEGSVDGTRAVAGLVAALRGLGADVIEGAALEAVTAAGTLGLHGGAEVDAGTVVIAAGAWSGAVAALAGPAAVPVSPRRGQLLRLEGVAPAPRLVLFGGLLGYAVARGGGEVLVGATEDDAGFDASPTEDATARLLAVAARLLSGAGAATRVAAWAGLRPRAPDALPILGELAPAGEGRPRLLIAAGHYRNGVLLAPVTARGMAQLALDGTAPDGWGAFSPQRF